MSRNKNDFFKMLAEMAESACLAADKLNEILKNFDVNDISKHMDELHEIESAGDCQKHLIAEKLAKEFITPIDREDIFAIASELDDVIDFVEDVLLKVYIFNVTSMNEEALAFSEIVRQCCTELCVMMNEFVHYKKSSSIYKTIIEINRLEEEGDALYVKAVRKLYVEKGDPIDTIAWTDIYNRFEKCCDACEHVSNIVENMIMKNI